MIALCVRYPKCLIIIIINYLPLIASSADILALPAVLVTTQV